MLSPEWSCSRGGVWKGGISKVCWGWETLLFPWWFLATHTRRGREPGKSENLLSNPPALSPAWIFVPLVYPLSNVGRQGWPSLLHKSVWGLECKKASESTCQGRWTVRPGMKEEEAAIQPMSIVVTWPKFSKTVSISSIPFSPCLQR